MRDRNINVSYYVSDRKGFFIRMSHGIILDTYVHIAIYDYSSGNIRCVFFESLFISYKFSKWNKKFLMTFIIHVFYSALCNVT